MVHCDMAGNLLLCVISVSFVLSAHGRVAESVLSNTIFKEEVVLKPGVIYLNISDTSEILTALTPKPRRPCTNFLSDLSENELHSDETEPCDPEETVDNGTALLLTNYIESGNIEDGRNAAAVDAELFLGFQSYSGFLTVDKTYDSNAFFWYFPVVDKPVNETPWIVWLQGGPGVSSMIGLFNEIGPFKVNHRGNLERNYFSWLRNHSLVFIENPIGTGYSFTNHQDGYARDMATYSKHLYSTIKQLVQLFPELRTAALFIAGESYAGKYVPALAMEIHKHTEIPGQDKDINFKGMIIGNAYVEPSIVSQVTKTFYHFGLLDQQQLEIVKPLSDAFQQDIASNRSVEAKEKWNQLIMALLMLSRLKHGYNFLNDDLVLDRYTSFLERSEVKRALHVGDIKYSFINVTVNNALAPDFLTSTRNMFEKLLNHYKVLAYCGQLDQMVPCAVTSEHYRSWQWGGSGQFLNATRLPYTYRNRLAGYLKSGGGLSEVVIRGAGHMAAADARGPTRALVAAWTHARPIPTAPIFDDNYIRTFVKNHTDVVLYL